MKMYNRGHVSLELIILIFTVILSAIITGVVMLNYLIDTTTVVNTKEMIFRGFYI